ncbi:MAG: hypothetical protein A2806_03195 [Candidatus Terrybacteria bacterium RIFCSPHIGHO2_01_FULL_48_17]|uniref:DUF4015 domain-containing protein n=1 Tax=Candidatus Terrybacteria bacterium RIFCSPHIGHO2_01_FULL_48_17 TaxID=1802362 RepID=A0A1G2PGV3_9BACT|nr:MAG: hypothetical protein A2806_03195 [Candidatus Terrybacteria bacterium RIFCSPHIGHO2_01_FULL_48_17]OHA53232.1 MAG: hypothetical protein A3A30_04415 [Candidatus Terrybacteria bacterium RIFCSPLOWO2_01_FULL_48_14]
MTIGRLGRIFLFAFAFGASFLLVAAFTNTTALSRERGRAAALAESFRQWHEYVRTRPPEVVKGIYLPAAIAGNKARRAELLNLVDATELNAVVIDLKDSRGWVTYNSEVADVVQFDLTYQYIKDLPEFLKELRAHSIWPIARLPVFEDTAFAEAQPHLSVQSKQTGGIWRDRKGLAWLDPSSREVWAYNVALAREAFALGFGEVQFDYIRFPSDGNISDMAFPVWDEKRLQHEVMAEFFSYLRNTLGERAVLSVDLFGMTMLKADYPDDDLGIGQRVIDAVPHFDFISPMVYPSHYPPTFQGFANPAMHPGEVVAYSMQEGASAFQGTRAKARPWLQDFDLGAHYTAGMVRAQIDASDQNGGVGWLLWNPAARYTEGVLRER